jgi:hypothetical protein
VRVDPGCNPRVIRSFHFLSFKFRCRTSLSYKVCDIELDLDEVRDHAPTVKVRSVTSRYMSQVELCEVRTATSYLVSVNLQSLCVSRITWYYRLILHNQHITNPGGQIGKRILLRKLYVLVWPSDLPHVDLARVLGMLCKSMRTNSGRTTWVIWIDRFEFGMNDWCTLIL